MRLWTVHPAYLDAKGLVALWREALLAQKVLSGQTVGYTRHPQLIRFRGHSAPDAAISAYLTEIANEADRRGYRFDRSKILSTVIAEPFEETEGQLRYEWIHLQRKLRIRAPEHLLLHQKVLCPISHPLFKIIPGDINPWEKTFH